MVSLLGFFVSVLCFFVVYYVATGDSGVPEFAVTPDAGVWNLGLALLVFAVLFVVVIVAQEF